MDMDKLTVNTQKWISPIKMGHNLDLSNKKNIISSPTSHLIMIKKHTARRKNPFIGVNFQLFFTQLQMIISSVVQINRQQ